MADASTGAPTQALIDGILAGKVPRQVRLFAAQGLLPISREELFRLQLLLTADGDEELAESAAKAIADVEAADLVAWVVNNPVTTLELDLLARNRNEPEIWNIVARQEEVSNQTLRMLAAHGTPDVQDIIITNQVRILGCLEILEDLRVNPSVNQVVLRRVKEFEEEFIEKAASGEIDDVAGGLPSIAEALDALRAIGAHLPKSGAFPIPDSSDPGVEEGVARMGGSAFGRILKMDVKGKVICAMRGSREERAILVNSRNRLVVRAVLASPKLNENEIEKYATSRSVSDEVIRVIAANPKWLRRYSIALALVQNPKTPVQSSMRLLPRLSVRDIQRVMKDRNVNPVVRRQAKNIYEKMHR
jgi:hypothetical protein